jgi:hypothetical protein
MYLRSRICGFKDGAKDNDGRSTRNYVSKACAKALSDSSTEPGAEDMESARELHTSSSMAWM